MDGRIENELKIYKSIEDSLELLPRFITEWYYYLKANNKSATTCRDYIRKAKKFLKYINSNVWRVTVDDITDDLVISFFASIQIKENNGNAQYTSDSYKQGIWSCLNNMFEYLAIKGKIPYNYIKKLKIERPSNKDLERINQNRILLTEEDFKKIIETVDKGAGSNKAKSFQRLYKSRDMCIMKIFMTTGIRKAALISINVEDIDLENKILTVTDKGRKVQEYLLSDSVIEAIDDWLISRTILNCGDAKGALFISKEGGRISQTGIDKIIAKYSKEALGYKISPHKLRAGFVSIIQSKTHDIEFTRRAVGHSNVSTTQRYIVTDNKEREKAGKIISELFK